MSLLEYSDKKSVNVIPKENYEELVHEVFGTVAETLSKSYGPLGSTSTIMQGMWSTATKDGYTIFKNLIFKNRYKAMVYSLMSSTCSKLNNTVGDGTTTAVLLADKLYSSYVECKEDIENLFLLPREFNDVWDDVVEKIIEYLNEYKTNINESDNIYQTIYDIAYVSSNGNNEISKAVAKVYSETVSPIIKLKNSPTNKSYMTAVTGFEFPCGLIDEAYCKNEDLSVEEEKIKVLLFSFKIDSDVFENIIVPINEALKAQGTKLAVFAPSYDELLMRTSLKSYINREFQTDRKLNLILNQFLFNKLNPYQLEDLATVIGCEVLDLDTLKILKDKINEPGFDVYDFWKNDEMNLIGYSEKLMMSIHNGAIFKDADTTTDKYLQQLRKAELHLETIYSKTDNEMKDYSTDIAQAKTRISQLQMKNYIYYIGADSQLASTVMYDMADDVIKACASAYKHGIIPGCQLAIIEACDELLKEYKENSISYIILSLIRNALISLYKTLLDGPDKNGIIRIAKKNETYSSGMYDEESIFNDILYKSLGRDSTIYRNENGVWNSIGDVLGTGKIQVFDMVSNTFSSEIITSVETDINVLLSASELVRLLISGNQFIFRETALDAQHEVQITP